MSTRSRSLARVNNLRSIEQSRLSILYRSREASHCMKITIILSSIFITLDSHSHQSLDGEMQGNDAIATSFRDKGLFIITRSIVDIAIPSEWLISQSRGISCQFIRDGQVKSNHTIATSSSGEGGIVITRSLEQFAIPSEVLTSNSSCIRRIFLSDSQMESHHTITTRNCR